MKRKQWTKEEFIEECSKQMANITDPKRTAALRCIKHARRYKAKILKAKMKKKGPRHA